MKKKLRQLFCKHDYVYQTSFLIKAGMRKLVISKCSKCGKVSKEVI